MKIDEEGFIGSLRRRATIDENMSMNTRINGWVLVMLCRLCRWRERRRYYLWKARAMAVSELLGRAQHIRPPELRARVIRELEKCWEGSDGK